MDPGQPGSHYGNARQLSPRRGLRALQGPSFDIFAQNEVDTQGPGQDLRHPDAGTTYTRGWRSTAAFFPVPPDSYAPPRCHAPPEGGQGLALPNQTPLSQEGLFSGAPELKK